MGRPQVQNQKTAEVTMEPIEKMTQVVPKDWIQYFRPTIYNADGKPIRQDVSARGQVDAYKQLYEGHGKDGKQNVRRICLNCSGEGFLNGEGCKKCNSTGKYTECLYTECLVDGELDTDRRR